MKAEIVEVKYVAIPREEMIKWMIGIGIIESSSGGYKTVPDKVLKVEFLSKWAHFEIEGFKN